MSRIVLAVGLIFLSAEAVRADDDFKTCATGAPDYAIMACTNLIEGGKLDARDQSVAYTNRAVAFRKRGTLAALGRRNEAIAYTNRGVAFRNRGGLNRALADLNRAVSSSPRTRRPSTPIAVLSINSRTSLRALLPISTARSSSIPTVPSFFSISERSMPA